MSEEMAKVLIESAGGIILALLAAVLLLWLLVFHRDRILARLSRVRSVSFLGVEVQLDVEGRMDRAVEERPIEVSVSRTDKRAAIARAQNALPVLRGARILWADDDPRGNLAEEELLRGFGVCIDHAVSTDEALTLVRRHRYDLVISDMKRGDDEHAGLGMCARLEAEDLAR